MAASSYWQRMPVVHLVFERLPATLLLALTSIVLSILVSVPLGVVAAARPGSWIDRTVVSGSLVGVSIAEFWLGLLLIVFVAAGLGLLPTSGYGTPAHIILPAITLAARPIGRITQIVRSSMLDELAQREVINTGVIVSPDVRFYPVSVDRFIREILDQEFRD